MHERGAILSRAADLLDASLDNLGRELSREEGKTWVEGRGEVARAAQIFRYVAGEADREAGQLYHSPRRGERIVVVRRPVGVVGVITPFNFPIAIPAWKIAPALVWGNTVVWKPASAVPLLAIRLTETLEKAGLPGGVLNLVIGAGQFGMQIAEQPQIDALTFTGSTTIGRQLAVVMARAGKPYQGEMGGKNSSIVLADADMDLALDQVVSGAFRASGQKCTATSRLIVEESVADAFTERLRARVAELRVGDPLDGDTYIGPVVDARSKHRLLSAIRDARDSGTKEVFGRENYREGPLAEGHYVSPTVFEIGDGADPAIWSTELFGPVLAMRRARSPEEAFALANDTEFGLSGSLFTRDVGRVLQGMEDLEVGVLHVNSESPGADPHVPFGGVKRTGLGPKEQGRAAGEFYSESTTVYLQAPTAAT